MYESNESKGYADQLNIETPEQVELRFPIAGIGSRFLAVLTDSLIQGATLFFLMILCFILIVSTVPRGTGSAGDLRNGGKVDCCYEFSVFLPSVLGVLLAV